MITEVSIAGRPVDLGHVLAENITVLHGRQTSDDPPTASIADLTLLIPEQAGMPGWAAGDPLTLTTEHGPLFTGTITDRAIPGHLDTLELGRCAQLNLIAAGPLAAAGYRVVGDTPWPTEPGSARAERILTAAGLPHLVQAPAPDEVRVLARDVDAQPALTLLEELATDTGAAVVDLPDGRILYQPLECRSRPVFRIRWQDFAPAATWDVFDPAATWADFDVLSPAADTPLDLPADLVEAEPQWRSSAAGIVNTIRVGYGPIPLDGTEQDTVTITDQASIDRYQQRYTYLGTQLASSDDALARAARVIAAQAVERWELGDVTVWQSRADPPQASALAALVCGDWVQVTDLPHPAPATAWAGIVEGWGYRETRRRTGAPDVWLTLALSDPLHSVAVPTWADYTPLFEWRQHPAYLTWADLTDLTVLGA